MKIDLMIYVWVIASFDIMSICTTLLVVAADAIIDTKCNFSLIISLLTNIFFIKQAICEG